MNYLIKQAKLYHQGHKHHLKTIDMRIVEGYISQIASKLTPSQDDQVIMGEKLGISIGFFDIGTHVGEPGYEYRETIESLCNAALSGGYTELAIFPNTSPVVQTKAEVLFLIDKASKKGIKAHVIGALSKDAKGVDISEYFDMYHAGSIGFSDGMLSLADNGLLSRALQYSKQLDVPILHHPYDKSLGGGEMHEGYTSTSLGLKGSPDIAETSIILRDQVVVEYTGGKLVEHCISSANGAKMIKAFKRKSQSYFATCAYMNLIHTDEDLSTFDTNLKVTPVLRSKSDRKALVAAIKDGSIDAIVSNHVPLDPEAKDLEFTYAISGAIGLETCFLACNTYLAKDIEMATIIDCLTIAPRRIFDLPIPVIEEGQLANLCVFDEGQYTAIDASSINSLSKNSPYLGKQLNGKIVKVFSPYF
jgi:dihydroorotase